MQNSISNFISSKHIIHNVQNLRYFFLVCNWLFQQESVLSSSPRQLEHLPQECLIRILSNLTCPQDLEMASQASPTLQNLVNDELLWKQLVLYHFNHQQLAGILPRNISSLDDCNWRLVYSRLLKRFGDQHFYPAKLHLCENCTCLFWPVGCVGSSLIKVLYVNKPKSIILKKKM